MSIMRIENDKYHRSAKGVCEQNCSGKKEYWKVEASPEGKLHNCRVRPSENLRVGVADIKSMIEQ